MHKIGTNKKKEYTNKRSFILALELLQKQKYVFSFFSFYLVLLKKKKNFMGLFNTQNTTIK